MLGQNLVIKSIHIPLRLINFYFFFTDHNKHTSNKSSFHFCLRRRSPVRIGTGRFIPRQRQCHLSAVFDKAHFRLPAPFFYLFLHAASRCHPDRCRPVADEFVKCLRVLCYRRNDQMFSCYRSSSGKLSPENSTNNF